MSCTETGSKGMGEGGTIGAPAAVLNAVNNALRDLGAQLDHIPVLPEDLVADIGALMKDIHLISIEVNGTAHELVVESRRTLADVLRQDIGLTGTHLGCEHGICGACTVLLDDEPVRACLVFGVQADGRKVRTVEGLADGDQLSDLQQAFSRHHALQCGFCTPGFLMLAEAYLADEPNPDADEAREVVAANLCRCTGYQGIVDAVTEVAASRQQAR